MADNQHKRLGELLEGGEKINGGYTTLAGHFLDFEVNCRNCKKKQVFPVEHEKHMHETLADAMNAAGWTWTADGSEDGVQLCSDSCRTFWELQK